jgi:hypothetical protein
MADPSLSKTYVLLDERDDSINDGFYAVTMGWFPDRPAQQTRVDYPSSYHDGAGGFSFADGTPKSTNGSIHAPGRTTKRTFTSRSFHPILPLTTGRALAPGKSGGKELRLNWCTGTFISTKCSRRGIVFPEAPVLEGEWIRAGQKPASNIGQHNRH